MHSIAHLPRTYAHSGSSAKQTLSSSQQPKQLWSLASSLPLNLSRLNAAALGTMLLCTPPAEAVLGMQPAPLSASPVQPCVAKQPEALPAVQSASSLTPVHQLSVGRDEFSLSSSAAAAAADPVSAAPCHTAVQMTVKPEDPSGLMQAMTAQAAAPSLAHMQDTAVMVSRSYQHLQLGLMRCAQKPFASWGHAYASQQPCA